MEKKKPIIANILQKWNDLSSARKRTVLTAAMFAVAALLIVIALIIGIASCAGAKQTPDAAEAVAPIPMLLRAPQNPERQAAAVDAQTGENEYEYTYEYKANRSENFTIDESITIRNVGNVKIVAPEKVDADFFDIIYPILYGYMEGDQGGNGNG